MAVPDKSTKHLIADIKKTWSAALVDAKSSMNKAIKTGELLIELKKKTPHGEWENTLNDAFDASFGRRHAAKLMSIAANKLLIEVVNPDEVLTISEMAKLVSDATPEQLERVKQIEAERIAAEEAKKAAKVEAKPAPEAPKPEPKPVEQEPIEAVFTEVKPEKAAANEPEPENSEIEHLRDLLSEQLSVNTDLQKDNDSLVKIFEANDQLTQAVAEVKRLNELNKALESRINGLLTERNELIKSHNSWKRKAEKLEKQLGGKNGVAA